MSLSPKAAAEQVGLTQRSIVKAIRTGRLAAERTGSGDWSIEPEALYSVWPPVDSSRQHAETYIAVHQDEVVAMLKAQIADLRTERDHWRDLAHRLAPAGPQAKPSSAGAGAAAVLAAVFGVVARSVSKRR